MSMPTIPEEKYRPCLKEVVIDLLASIALEEMALGHLVNAEAEKIQAFNCIIEDTHSCNKLEDFLKFNSSIGKIVDTVVMKEWILYKKLEEVMQINYEKKDECKAKEPCEKHEVCESHIISKENCGSDNKVIIEVKYPNKDNIG